MWNGASDTESSGSVVLSWGASLIPRWFRCLWQFCFVVCREMAGSLRSPLRGTRSPACAPQLSCVYANVALGVDIDSCSLGAAGDWSGCLSGVLLSGPLASDSVLRHKQSGEIGCPGDVIRCFVSSWSHVRKQVTSARLCCFKPLRVAYPISQPDGGNALVLSEALRHMIFSCSVHK